MEKQNLDLARLVIVLLADVRYNIKNKVNGIKRRQKFRPFAPAILEEFALEYFDRIHE